MIRKRRSEPWAWALFLGVSAATLALSGGGWAAPARRPAAAPKKARKPAPKPRVISERVISERVIIRETAPASPRAGQPGEAARAAPSRGDHAPPTWAEQEEHILRDVNRLRKEHGLAALKVDPRLTQVARDYSRRMALEKFFAHTSPTGEDVDRRVEAAGVDWSDIAENLARSVDVPEPWKRTAANWMTSPVHRENLLSPTYTDTGLGIWRIGDEWFFTQVFVKPF